MSSLHQVRVHDAASLDKVNWIIHDQVFELDTIQFDEQRNLLTIPFEFEDFDHAEVVERTRRGRIKRARVPLLRGVLRIHGVEGLQLEDTAQVGWYDFNQLRFDSDSTQLTIETNIPLHLSAHVTELDVSVEVTDQVVGYRDVKYFPLGIDYRSISPPSD